MTRLHGDGGARRCSGSASRETHFRVQPDLACFAVPSHLAVNVLWRVVFVYGTTVGLLVTPANIALPGMISSQPGVEENRAVI